ncbi:Argininosuccinate lyase 1 [Anaerohalosphaera lusitana]|uniref:Argininosuccinate lyase n=1 Tax=Anaerohalosphaera lusitana TaxID=1936003 RepID=A0A1U9NLS9_9BACT|nr:argininosuccinate lyase [Anaerohalosphaera lusitana]AQT68891.1 Argininosuccinate lyase 1 [Anaerohalosphaera lusitana]
MAKGEKSWEKRLSGEVDQLAVNYVESLSYDRRLYKYDIQGSIAHAQMLCAKGFLTADELDAIKGGLAQIQDEIEAGQFEFNVLQEDIHMAVEAALTEKIGDPGRKLHTGRSRNDQIATDMRLWMREEIDILRSKVRDLQGAFVELASKYTKDMMPAYTHLQRAQPIAIGAYLLSFVEMLERDYQRLGDCRKRVNVSPLGSGAVAGSTIPLDRAMTAELLGFEGVMRNSMDGMSDRDFCAEFTFACSLAAVHLSRFAEDFIIYSSSEFDFVRIDDKYCTSSSMMPQKRNPDMLELMRGKTGNIFGSLSAMLMMLKSQPSTYNRDMQEDKLHIFSAADVLRASLDIATAIVSNTQFKTADIAAGLDKGFLDATCLAEYLVRKGVPFRKAHGIVGGLVAECEKQGLAKLADLPLETFTDACDVIEKDVYDNLGATNVVKQYASAGSAGTKQVEEQVAFWRQEFGQ